MMKLDKSLIFNTGSFLVNLWGTFLAIIFVLLLSEYLISPSGAIMKILVLSPITIFFFIKPKIPVYLLFLSVIFTEFLWIEILHGYLKPFHIISILLFLIYSIFHLKILGRSTIIKLFIAFIIINMISILLSKNVLDSLRSFVLPLILISIAVNTAVALYTNKTKLNKLKKIILYGSLIVVIFGILQMVGYSFFKINLSFTERQYFQIDFAKRPPSFFTEADTFGKFLTFPFFFLLPFALEKKDKSSRKLKIGLIFLLIGILINMTRSSMVGIGITLILYVFYLFKTKSLSRSFGVLSASVAVILILLPFIVGITKIIGSHDELVYRFQTLTNPTWAAMEDPSVLFRKLSLEETYKGIFENKSTFLWGHGWGQSSLYFRGALQRPSVNLFLSITYFSGFFTSLLFFVICYRILKFLFTILSKSNDNKKRLFAEGLFFSFLCMLITSQIASMFIAPEFWLVIGCAIYLEVSKRKIKSNKNSHLNHSSSAFNTEKTG